MSHLHPLHKTFIKIAHAKKLLQDALSELDPSNPVSGQVSDSIDDITLLLTKSHDDVLEQMGYDPRAAARIKEAPPKPQKASAVPQKAKSKIQLKKG